MRLVIQRVKGAHVEIDGETVGRVGPGLMVLAGVEEGDTRADVDYCVEKTAHLRIFEDEAGKMNRSVLDIGGGALVISNFTLCADTRRGNRPSFDPACEPERAEKLYEYFSEQLRAEGVAAVANGRFGADMAVDLLNDGPVTLILDTDTWAKKV